MGVYSKSLSGQNAKVFINPLGVEYTSDSTYEEFVANAVEGEIGVFLANNSLKSTALSAGDLFFIAQKRDGIINKTPLLNWSDLYRKGKTDYSAPTRQVTHIGYNGSSGDIGFDFTGASASNPIDAGIEVRETTPGNQPFPVQEGRAVVTSATADEYTVLAQIVSQINEDFDYENAAPDRFVKAEIVANGAITEFAATSDPTVTNGSVTVTFAANVTVATGALVIFRGAVYKAAVGVTTGQVITLDRPYQGVTETIDVDSTVDQAGVMAYTSGTTLLGVKLTGLRDESHFVVTVNGNIGGAPITKSTPWSKGSGSGAEIVELEKEAFFFDGVGSTQNAAFKEDYGEPSKFASAAGTYNQIFLEFAPSVIPSAALPIYKQYQIQRVQIVVPSSGTTPDTELETIFGV
jgi:hypothetical protein